MPLSSTWSTVAGTLLIHDRYTILTVVNCAEKREWLLEQDKTKKHRARPVLLSSSPLPSTYSITTTSTLVPLGLARVGLATGTRKVRAG